MPNRVAVCVPAYETWAANFGRDLVSLALTSYAKLGPVVTASGTYLQQVREELAEIALRDSAVTHLLFLDADMRFPPDALERLLARRLPVVGANYRRRRPPHDFTASVSTGPLATGVERADRLGFGCVLIAAREFRGMARPWFNSYWQPDGV